MPNSPVRAEIFDPEAHIFVWRRHCEIYLTHPAPEVCVLGGGTKSDPEDGVSRGVSVMVEIFDPEDNAVCVRMPLGRSPKWSRFWGTSPYPNKIRYWSGQKQTKTKNVCVLTM